MVRAKSAKHEILPYQGSALPLSYGSAGGPYALESQGNQWPFAKGRKIAVPAIRAALGRTERESAELCGTFWSQCCSAPVPAPPLLTQPLEGGGKMRPFFPFYGSKWNIARYYPVPKHGQVIEPFAGGAGYSTFYRCPRVRLIDADPIIVGVWDFLIGTTAAEVMALPELPEVGDNVDNCDLPQEAKWLIGFWLNRGSATPKKSRTAYSARTDRAQLNWGPRAKERIAGQLPALADWSIKLGQFDSAPNEMATWFIDPPYGDKGRFYRMQFSDFDRLGAWAQERRGLVISCEGPKATWLPFAPLGSFKSTKGRALEMVHIREAPDDSHFQEPR